MVCSDVPSSTVGVACQNQRCTDFVMFLWALDVFAALSFKILTSRGTEHKHDGKRNKTSKRPRYRLYIKGDVRIVADNVSRKGPL